MLNRPLIDPTPDQPLRFYGFHVDRGGVVNALTSPTRRGRVNPNHLVCIGSIIREGSHWIAYSPGGLAFSGRRQQDAARALYDWSQARYIAHHGTNR